MRIGQRVIITNPNIRESFKHLSAEELEPIVLGAKGTIVEAGAQVHEVVVVQLDQDPTPTVFFEEDIAPLMEHLSITERDTPPGKEK